MLLLFFFLFKWACVGLTLRPELIVWCKSEGILSTIRIKSYRVSQIKKNKKEKKLIESETETEKKRRREFRFQMSKRNGLDERISTESSRIWSDPKCHKGRLAKVADKIQKKRYSPVRCCPTGNMHEIIFKRSKLIIRTEWKTTLDPFV